MASKEVDVPLAQKKEEDLLLEQDPEVNLLEEGSSQQGEHGDKEEITMNDLKSMLFGIKSLQTLANNQQQHDAPPSKVKH